MLAIRPCLWFATQAEEAARLSVSRLPASRMVKLNRAALERAAAGP